MNNSKLSQEFKTGDTVQLKSGGPIMTVESYNDKGYLRCQWFTGEQDKVYHDYFPPNSLQLVAKPH